MKTPQLMLTIANKKDDDLVSYMRSPWDLYYLDLYKFYLKKKSGISEAQF